MADPALLSDSPDPSFGDLLAARPALAMDSIAGLMMEEVPLVFIDAATGRPRNAPADLLAALAGFFVR